MNPLERLLPKDIILDADHNIPLVNLQDVSVTTKIYGIESSYKNEYGLVSGKLVHYPWQYRLHVYSPPSNLEHVWNPAFTINGRGYFNSLLGVTKYFDIRVTVDGISSLIITSTNKDISHLIWGRWSYTKSSKAGEGKWYYSSFDEHTEEYLSNFAKGAVKFESQLKIEYMPKDYTKYTNIGVDYIMESEIS